MAPPIPANEAARLAALQAYGILDTLPESEYDDLVRLASVICGTPMAAITLIDRDRQWLKARIGIGASETSRADAFCAHTILDDAPMVVDDATADDRFRANPLVVGDPNIRFYAGVPLADAHGHNLGALCVIDTQARSLTDEQRDALAVLSRQVVALLLSRRRMQLLEQARLDAKHTQERFLAFMNAGPVAAFMKDAAGRYRFVNDALLRRFTFSMADWIGRTDHDLFPAHADAIRVQDQAVLAGETVVEAEEITSTPDGGLAYWQSYKFPVVDSRGTRLLAGIAIDVTDRRKSEIAVREGETKFRNTIDRLAEGVFMVDGATGRFVDANRAILAMLGYTRDELLALDAFAIVANETPEVFAENMARMQAALAEHGRADVGHRQYLRKDGSVVDVDIHVTVVPHGEAGLHAVIARDMSDQLSYESRLLEKQRALEDANEKLRVLSVTDGLTGVLNWAAFQDRLAAELDRARRYGRPISLVMLDIDHFKSFNDTFGHPAGDEVIRDVAAILKSTVRASDIVARVGGEELAVILPETEGAGALDVAERLRAAIAGAPWPHRAITVSVGVATAAPDARDPGALVGAADSALYASKHGGRNRVSAAAPT